MKKLLVLAAGILQVPVIKKAKEMGYYVIAADGDANAIGLKYADKAVTPTLFIHSEQDYRCWLTEGLQMFTALKYHGVEARLCMFRGENHELSRSGKPRHRVRRLEEITNWFEEHLK